MSHDISKILSRTIDADLVTALIDSYNSVHKEYSGEDYEGTLSKSGKFVENVFRVLYFIISGNKLDEIKQGQISELFDKLEKSDGKKFSDTIRIVIPRVAMTIYTMRSKLGGEHVKPTVPDFIDARLTISACDWILAELLRSYHVRDPSQIDELIQRVKDTSKPKLETFQVLLANKIDNLSIPELIVIMLRIHNTQTKSQMINELKNLGRDISSWFKGGNVNKRLLQVGLIQKVGENEKNEDIFSLTIKGTIISERLFDKVISQKGMQPNDKSTK